MSAHGRKHRHALFAITVLIAAVAALAEGATATARTGGFDGTKLAHARHVSDRGVFNRPSQRRRFARAGSDVPGTITPGGSPLTVTISNSGDNAAITFSGTANQRVSLNLTAVSISFSYVSIRKPDGTDLVSSRAVFTSGKFIDTVTLPTTGTYTIYIDPNGTATGSMTLTLYDVPADQSGTITAGGPSVTASVGTPGQNSAFTFTANAGDRFSVNATNITLNTGYEIISVKNPSGGIIAGSGATSSHYFFDTMTATTSGTYTIFVDPQDQATGTTILTLYSVPDNAMGTIAIGGASRSLTVTVPGHNPTLTFTGDANELVKVQMTGSTILYSNISIQKPLGTKLVETSVFTGSATVPSSPPYKLPSSGTYYLVVDPIQEDTGSMTLALKRTDAFEPPEQGNGTCDGSGDVAITGSRCLADPVNSLTGAYTLAVTDLTLPGKGLPFDLTRTYSSANAVAGRFGPGWADTYGASLAIQQNGDVVFHGIEGQVVRYARDNDGSFVGAGGARAALTTVTGGYRLLRRDQVAYGFDTSGKLTSLTDPNGNTVTLAYDGGGHVSSLTDSAGRTITFTNNADGTVASVSVPDGRTVSYSYTSGRLTAVTDPAAKTTTYHYDSGGRLDQVVDPNGHTQVQNTYGSDGRVTQQTDAAGNSTTFAWDSGTQTATATDARGNAWKDVYSNNVLIKRIDPLGNTTQYASDVDLNVTSITSPGGSQTTMGYDANGNETRVTAPASVGAQKTSTYDSNNNRTSVTDARGKVTSYSYDGNGNLTSVVHDGATVSQFTYSGTGDVATSVSAGGGTTTYTHDSSGNVTSATDPLGNKTTYTYDSAGRMTSEVAPRGNVQGANPDDYKTTFTYDADGRLLTATDPLGHTTTYTYDSAGNTTSVIDALGRTTTMSYDVANRLASVTTPGGGVMTYGYDAAGNRVTETDARNHTTTYAYDAANRLVSLTSPKGNKTTYTYNADGNVVKEVAPRGNVSGANPDDYATSLTYDAAGRLLTKTDALGHTTSYAYDGDGNQTRATDANGHVTTFAYDGRNRLVSVTDPTGGVTSFTYDSNGNQLTKTDPAGHVTTYTYDTSNRVTSWSTPLGNKTTYSYDVDGNLTKKVEPRGNVQGANPDDYATSYVYDAAGRMTSQTDPLGHTTSFTYDAANQKTSTTDADGHTTSYGYDSRGRLTTVTAPGSLVTTYAYDAVGNLTGTTDPNGHTTTYSYDEEDRRVSRVLPGGQTWTFAYDPDGHLASVIDANGNATQTAGDGTTNYAYDRVGRLSSIDYSDSTPDVSFTYDAAGNKASMTDGAGTETYDYDAADRLKDVIRGTDTFSYTYDSAGNLTRRSYPGGRIVDYGYDQDSRLNSATSDSLTTSYQYDAAGNVTTTTLPSANGYVEQRVYDRAGRLTEVTNSKSGSILSRFTYTLDPAGLPTTVVRAGNAPGTTTYEYDSLNRLTSVCFQTSCPGASDPFIRWTYDGAGNRLTETRPGSTVSYTYDSSDRLTQAGGTSFSYDQNGNELQAGSSTFSYDLANRLLTSTAGGVTTTYTYDGNGNRLSESKGSQPSDKTSYVWDLSQPVPQVAIERDGSGTTLRSYAYGLHRISMNTGGSVHYFHYDGLGSVVNVTSATGGSEWTYSYEPFGAVSQTKDDPSAPANFMKFAGERADDSGLLFLRARQYDPTNGRFLQVDPAPAPSGASASSTYAYVADSPTVFVDPSGMTPGVPNALPNDGQTKSYDAASPSDVPPAVKPPEPGGCSVGGGSLYCTVPNFTAADWAPRVSWVRKQSTYAGLWLNAIAGAIRFFGQSETFKDSKRVRASDAYTIFAIEAGIKMAWGLPDSIPLPPGGGSPAGEWAAFFALRKNFPKPPNNNQVRILKHAWARAEQDGVDWGIRSTANIGFASECEKRVFHQFVWKTNIYRKRLSENKPFYLPGYGEWLPDPRYDESTLINAGKFIEEASRDLYFLYC